MEKKFLIKGIVCMILVLLVGVNIVSAICIKVDNVNRIKDVEKDQDYTDDMSSSGTYYLENYLVDNPNVGLEWENYWNENWSYCKKIIINHTKVDADLSNFPILFHNTSSDFISHAQDDGDDFVFLNSDNTTKYNHEIERYDNTTGELIAWVNITELSCKEDTIIWIWYGNETTETQENVENTWNSNYVGVWHMNDNFSTTSIKDSTIYDNDGTKDSANEPIVNSSGKVGDCQTFDGNNDRINAGNDNSINMLDDDWTLEGLAYCSDEGFNNFLFNTRGSGASEGYDFRISPVEDRVTGYIHDGINGWTPFHGANDDYDSKYETWCYCVATYDRDGVGSVYLDTVLSGTPVSISGESDTVVNAYNLGLGCDMRYSENGFHGSLDELRISNVHRNSSWIKTTYNTTFYPESFLTVGSENQPTENQPPDTPVIDGPTSGEPGVEYCWAFRSIDPNGDNIYYYIEWGDGNDTGWIGPYPSNTEVTECHTYEKNGTYTINAKSKDIHNSESDWSFLEVNIYEDENQPPDPPSIGGPNSGEPGVHYCWTFRSIDPNDDIIYYYIEWGDGNITGWIGPYPSNIMVMKCYTYENAGTYIIHAKSKDIYHAESDWSSLEVNINEFENQPPDAPVIYGPSRGKTNIEYNFTFNAIDPDGDDVKYSINWGDTINEWTDFNVSGTNVTVKHKFDERRYYTITAKAQDIHGAESPIGSLAIYIPRNRPFNFNVNMFDRLFERFPNLFPILRYILEFQ